MEKPLQRIVTGAALDEDARIDASVRPKRLADYIGQSRVKENIEIAIQAARAAVKRSTTCCSMDRLAWQNDACTNYRERTGRRDQDQFRSAA